MGMRRKERSIDMASSTSDLLVDKTPVHPEHGLSAAYEKTRVITKPSLGETAIEAWRKWRGLPWQNTPCFALAPGLGEFCWQRNGNKPCGYELHRVINALATRPATELESDEVWKCLLSGVLRIYTRRNLVGVPNTPIRILHERTGTPVASGISE